MKKILLAALPVLMLAGCGQEHPIDHNSGYISLQPSTSRTRAGEETLSSVVDINALQANGFTVWATTANNTTGWMAGVAGVKHEYSSGAWNFATPVPWPISPGPSYPMTFYAAYPTPAEIIATGSNFASTGQLAVNFTVPAAVADQLDLVGAKVVTNERPASDQLAITFHHLLSKIDFTFTVGADVMVYLAGLGIENVGEQGTFDFIDGMTWETPPVLFTSRYDYYNTYGTPLTFSNTVKAPVFTGLHPNHLMLMPQNAPDHEWSTVAVPTTENYVSMLYRMEKGTTTDYVGYPQAQLHPAFATDGGATSATSPLYAKVGFPFTLDWVAGKGYIYDIPLSSIEGGYLLDQNFYDEAGVRTNLLLGDLNGDGAVDPAQPVPPQAVPGDGNIHLVPTVEGWDDNAL